MSAPLAHLSELRTRGWEIFGELGLESARRAWARDLVVAAKPFSEVWAGKFKTIGHVTGAEDRFARRYQRSAADKVANKRRLEAIYFHAVQLHRLDKLLDKIESGAVATPKPEDEPAKAAAPKAARPRGKPGQRPKDPQERIAAVQAAIDEQKRRGLERNVEGTIIEVLDTLDLTADEYERAFQRLKKKKWR